MPLVRDDDLVRIDLPENGEWVEVKRRLSRGDEVTVQRASVKGSMLQGGTEFRVDAESALDAAEFAVLDLVIKRWSFEERVTPEAIRMLDGEAVDAIKVRLEELYASRTDDERKNSSAATQPQSSEKALSLATSNGAS